MAAEADGQLHSAVSKAPRMISHPWAVNDILQVFFEMNYDYFLKGRIFRLTSPNSWTCIQRIYEWFREHPDILLKFRQPVLLYPGVPSYTISTSWSRLRLSMEGELTLMQCC
jgi:hypothetical protein